MSRADLDATGDTGFMIASISKTITATAAMQQVEQGRISLDADISTHLPFTLRNPLCGQVAHHREAVARSYIKHH